MENTQKEKIFEIAVNKQHEKLISRKQTLYANLLNTLTEKQFTLFSKYISVVEQIQKKEMTNLINTILRHKKK